MRNRIVAAACGVALAACGGNEQSGTIDTEDGEIAYSIDQGSDEMNATFTGPDGEQITMQGGPGAAVSLPEGFSVYPGASVVSSTTLSGGNGSGSMVMLESPDGPADVVAFYRGQAEAAGMEIKMEMNSGGMQMVTGEGPDGLVFSINASAGDDGGSTAQLTVGNQM